MNLLLFLSDRCNMACGYCFLSLNEHPTTILTEASAVSAVSAHAARFGFRARVTILGGEPLLHPELIRTIVRRTHRSGAKFTLVTNGTKMAPNDIEGLLDLGIEVVVSVDGGAPSHDLQRRFLGGGHTHDVIAASLSRLDVKRLRANLVVSEATVPAFLTNIEALRELGFRRVSFHADVLNSWSEDGLRILEGALSGFVRYVRIVGKSQSGLSFAHLDSYRRLRSGLPGDEEIILGADGRYYLSDAWLSLPYGRGLDGAVGDAVSGPDWARRRALLAAADAEVARVLGPEPYYTWPREAWLLARISGRDPEAAVKAFHRADSLIGRALGGLVRETTLG